ncbi:MAG: hypothetical protein KAS97_02640 [Candidatus Aminicenantes bacterium]|nr:hypothetical protein [Candidatus Aminicenantes bacterium]
MSKHAKGSRCPMGIPAGIISVIIGVAGIVLGIMHKELTTVLFGVALFFLGGPMVGSTMMLHRANDRLDELEKSIKK